MVVLPVGPDDPQAQAEAEAIAVGLGWMVASPTSATEAGVGFRPAGNEFTGDDLQMSAIFGTIVGLILLLAVTNVANILVAGATARQQEIGSRLALGASRARIVRQLLTESLLLGLLAGAAGFAMTWLITPLIAAMFYIPPAIDLAPDLTLVAFITSVSVLFGVAAGLAPARVGTRMNVVSVLKGGTQQAGAAPRARRLRAVFLAVQAAASVMLLILTALFTRALLQASRPDLPVDRLVTIATSVSPAGVHVADETFWGAALQRVRSLPGVENAAVLLAPPLRSAPVPANVTLEGRRYRVEQNQVSPEYFDILGLGFVAGRPYTLGEYAQNAPVAIITSSLANDFWPRGDALGATLDQVSDFYAGIRVIGIVADLPPPPGSRRSTADSGVIYRPVSQPDDAQMLVLLTSQGAASFHALGAAVGAIDPGREPRLSRVSDELDRRLAAPRAFALAASILGALALVLAVIGILGVTFVLVGQRRRELGLRMAIGATSWDVVGIVVRQGMWPVIVGLVVGIGLAWMGTQVIRSYLVGGVSARDPLSFGFAATVLLASAAAGLLIPARRAIRVNPVTVLREP